MTVFEKADRIGGLLRYGIPDFKMEKHRIDRRMEQMDGGGRRVRDQRPHRRSVSLEDLRRDFQAVVLAMGAEHPRDLQCPRARAEGHPFRHGFSAAAESARRGRHGDPAKADSGHRQAT